MLTNVGSASCTLGGGYLFPSYCKPASSWPECLEEFKGALLSLLPDNTPTTDLDKYFDSVSLVDGRIVQNAIPQKELFQIEINGSPVSWFPRIILHSPDETNIVFGVALQEDAASQALCIIMSRFLTCCQTVVCSFSPDEIDTRSFFEGRRLRWRSWNYPLVIHKGSPEDIVPEGESKAHHVLTASDDKFGDLVIIVNTRSCDVGDVDLYFNDLF
eukprot:GILI01046226.1.p1 GENE.GILI01046226.1~~GILI01046226.1.p1  ORF type:complete len:215 (-),score=23.03 GILI01046226.1:10-654(-)